MVITQNNFNKKPLLGNELWGEVDTQYKTLLETAPSEVTLFFFNEFDFETSELDFGVSKSTT